MRSVLAAALSFALAATLPWAARAQARPELLIQLGHSDELKAAAFSRDGRYLATASEDKTAALWNAATGQELRIFKGHTRTLSSVAFSPDGKFLATGSDDATARLWNTATGEELRVLKGHDGSVSSVAFSPNGRLLATAGGGAVRLWNTATGRQLRALDGHTKGVASVAFSPDGKLVATAGADETARLWNARTGKLLRVLQGHASALKSIAFSPDGKLLVTVDVDAAARLWNTRTGEEVSFPGQAGKVSSVAFSPDGKSFAAAMALTGSKAGTRLWSAATGEELRVLKEPYGERVESVAFSPDGKSLATISRWAARLWSADTGEMLRHFTGKQSGALSVAFSPDGKLLATGLFDNTARLWSTASGGETHALGGHPNQVTDVVFSPDGRQLVTTVADLTARTWNAATGEAIPVPKSLEGKVYALAFSPDGKSLATADETTARVWERASGQEIAVLKGHTTHLSGLAFSPDGRLLAAASSSKTLVLWNAATGEEVRTVEGPWVSGVIFSPDGKSLATHGTGGTSVYDTVTGKELVHVVGPDGYTASVAFSPDGKSLATAGLDKARVWDAATGKELRVLQGHASLVSAVAFSPDGRFLATASYDGTTILWSASSGKELCKLISMKDKGWAVVSPEGFFDGSPEGLRSIRWTVGLQSFPLEAFSEGYYVPAILARLLAGEPIVGGKLPKLSERFALPPSVKITSPQAGAALESAEADVTVAAADQGGGVDEIRLYQNGKAVPGDVRGVKIVGRTQTFHVTLVDGDNVFRAVALSRDRIESNPDELTVAFAGPQKQATLHVVAVGINEYKNSSMNLNYAQPDAKALSDFFTAAPRTLFKEVRTHELFNASATKARILAQLAALKSARPQDIVLIYLAGHGDTLADNWYFIPYDLVYPEREDAVRSQGLSSREIQEAMKEIGAQKVLLMLDACKSGEALQAFAARGLEDRKALTQLARATGVHVVAASTKDQFASELKELGHGVFTYTLLEGLGGKAAAADGTITVRGLLTYVENRLPELSQKYKAQAQYPVVDSRGMDFPISTAR